ncbi:hypothetical protein E6C27_scaffold511G001170 [Cucumis melo var. makuwa]|uniref:Uncharacterized protein n=1 Tax=Cucumis melo var. makuwa TaxID=1194695 RepID=A0A5A7U775_CUCMM|nr:hypothetical protein E6C27_scaffold511G001170 [Cucumis melo var. makuwa]
MSALGTSRFLSHSFSPLNWHLPATRAKRDETSLSFFWKERGSEGVKAAPQELLTEINCPQGHRLLNSIYKSSAYYNQWNSQVQRMASGENGNGDVLRPSPIHQLKLLHGSSTIDVIDQPHSSDKLKSKGFGMQKWLKKWKSFYFKKKLDLNEKH